MATLDKLDNSGILQTQGELDEVTGSAVSANGTVYRSAEFDEVTISPVSGGLAKRVHSSGLIQVANYFDEYTLSSLVSSGLVSYLDVINYSGSGTTWPDASGNNNDATLVSPDYQSGPPAYFQFTSGSYASMGKVLNRNSYTKCAMIYVDTISSDNIISGTNGDLHAFWLGGTSYLNAGHNGDTGGSWMTVTGSTALNTGQWYFAAVTFDYIGGWNIYLNGELDGTSGNTLTFSGSDPGDALVGSYQAGNWFYGRIPVAMVYNRALTQTEIQSNFQSLRGRFGI